MPDAEMPDGEMPDAEMPDGEMPDGEMPDAEMPDAEMPDAGRVGSPGSADQLDLTSANSLVRESLASPKSSVVFGS
jgi:hypothetical protein